MNRTKFKELHGKLLRIRPPVRRLLHEGSFLPWKDDQWRVDTQFPAPGAVARLTNLRTMHVLDIYADGVQEFRNPDVVFLKTQLTLYGNEIRREELADRRLAYPRSQLDQRHAQA